MVYVVLQIKSGVKIIKPWLGKRVNDDETLLQIYNRFASGELDDTECIPDEFNSVKVSDYSYIIFTTHRWSLTINLTFRQWLNLHIKLWFLVAVLCKPFSLLGRHTYITTHFSNTAYLPTY